jgi:hypothetical protein
MNVALNSTICSMKKVFEELSNKLEAGASSSKDGSGGAKYIVESNAAAVFHSSNHNPLGLKQVPKLSHIAQATRSVVAKVGNISRPHLPVEASLQPESCASTAGAPEPPPKQSSGPYSASGERSGRETCLPVSSSKKNLWVSSSANSPASFWQATRLSGA